MSKAVTPILSIAIVNLNYGRFLEAALRSVVSQCGEAFSDSNGRVLLPLRGGEHIEILLADGGSSDESLEIIRKYADKLAWWVSEPDEGQSNAFNKCFSHAIGRFLTWLNADDIIFPGALEKVVRAIRRHPDCEWFTANSIRFTSDGSVYSGYWGPNLYPKWLQCKSSPFVSFGPSTFFSRRIYENVGRLDERMHYIMDTDLWCRFIMAGIKQRRINCFFWGFRVHDDSKTGEYGTRKLTAEVFKKISKETKLSHERSGYKMSSLMRIMTWAWRVMDGSMFLHILFQHRPKLLSGKMKGIEV